MLSEQVINLLSHHRFPGKSYLPQSLTRFQLMGLLRNSVPPSVVNTALTPATLDQALHFLEAQGEILIGVGKRVCMAQPTVLAENHENLIGLQFLGDRAYLRLAHQALGTGQPVSKTLLRPQKQSFQWIQEQLQGINIRCLTVEQAVEQLPSPRLPSSWSLRGQECSENPFFTYQGLDSIQGYRSTQGSQQERWTSVVGLNHLANLSHLHLLKTPEGDFLWMEDGQFFEITSDTAYLAMFYLDQQAKQPLRLAWDELPGRLDLSRTYLPRAYAQLIWRLSSADSAHNRTRLIEPQNRPTVKAAMKRLGCVLV